MGGATEATLAELLAVAQAMNVNMVKLNAMINQIRQNGGMASGGSSGSTGSAASSAASGLSRLASSLNPVNLAMTALEGAATLVGKVFSTMFEIVGKVASGLMSAASGLAAFSVQAATTGARLSDFYNAFKGLPFFIGEAASFFARIVSFAESLLDSYREMTKAGASFTGNLFAMRDAAARAQLTLGEFQSVIANNSELFATLGGNAQAGINRFVQIQERLMGPNSPYARQMMALGYTSQEAAEAIASFMRSQGTMNKEELKNTELVTQGVVAYARELDLISKITGKNREKLESELKSIEIEETYQQFLAGITDPREAAAIRAAVANALETGGKDFAEQVKLAAQGIYTSVTPGQTALAAATQGMSIEVARNVAMAARQGRSAEEIGRMMREQAMQIGRQQQRLFAEIGTEGVAALKASGSTVVTAGADFQKYARTVGNLTEAQIRARERQTEQERGNAANFAMAQQNIRNFGNQLLSMALEFIDPTGSKLGQFGESITKNISNLLSSKGFKEAVTGVSTWFSDTLNDLTNAKTADEFWDVLVNRGSKAFNSIVDTVTPMWNKTVAPALEKGWNNFVEWMKKTALPQMEKFYSETLKPMLANVFQTVLDFIIYELRTRSALARMALPESDREGKEKRYEQLTSGQLQRDMAAELKKYYEVDPKLRNTERALGYLQAYQEYNRQFMDLIKEFGTFDDQGRPPPKPFATRHLGTMGVLGKSSEPESTTVGIQQGERVLSPTETYSYNNLEQSLQRLNSYTAQMIGIMREQADYARRNLDATKALSNNLFA